MEGLPDGLQEADRCLEQAIRALEEIPVGSPWRSHLDDLKLLKEQVVDIRQQLAFLKLETTAEPETAL